MSPSDESAKVSDLADELSRVIERTIQDGKLAGVAVEGVTKLMSDAVKLYAAVAEETERDIPVIDSSISTTEAVVVACALLRAHRLNPFDLAIWFSRTAPRSGPGAQGA